MIVTIKDLRTNLPISENEKILDVYFLVSETKKIAYRLAIPLIKTNLALYMDNSYNYSFESSGGGIQTITNIVRNVLKKENNANFKVICISDEEWNYLANNEIIELKVIPKNIRDCSYERDILEKIIEKYRK